MGRYLKKHDPHITVWTRLERCWTVSRKRIALQLLILGWDIEVVKDFRYLGVNIHNILNWKTTGMAVYNKEMSRHNFLKLRSFNMWSRMLGMYYQSFVDSALFFSVFCGGSSIRDGDTDLINWLSRLVLWVSLHAEDLWSCGEEEGTVQTVFYHR